MRTSDVVFKLFHFSNYSIHSDIYFLIILAAANNLHGIPSTMGLLDRDIKEAIVDGIP